MNKITPIAAVLITAAVSIVAAAPPSVSKSSSERPSTARAGSYVPVTPRGVYAGQIITKWAGYVREVYGSAPGTWANNMAPTFAQADVRNMSSALKRKTFEGMMSTLMGQHTSDATLSSQMTKSSGSLAAIQALGSPSTDLVYTAVTPCRLFDTRVVGGPLAAGETRSFVSSGANFTAQGGATTDCNIPADVPAVVVNTVAVKPPGEGYVTAFPFGQTQPLAASVNFVPRLDVGNELIIKQTMGQAFDFSVFAFSQTHLVGDVAGYFAAPLAVALECVQVLSSATALPALSSTIVNVDACAAGFTSTAIACFQPGLANPSILIAEVGLNSCTFSNLSAVLGSGTAVRTCCRVPGR